VAFVLYCIVNGESLVEQSQCNIHLLYSVYLLILCTMFHRFSPLPQSVVYVYDTDTVCCGTVDKLYYYVLLILSQHLIQLTG